MQTHVQKSTPLYSLIMYKYKSALGDSLGIDPTERKTKYFKQYWMSIY